MAKKTLLVVDDDRIVRQVVAVSLGQEKYVILHAAGGPEALAVALEQRPNLVLLDVSMPGMDGFEVCSKLKSNPATAACRVIMFTGLLGEYEQERALLVGADALLRKPFSPIALLDKVGQLLGC